MRALCFLRLWYWEARAFGLYVAMKLELKDHERRAQLKDCWMDARHLEKAARDNLVTIMAAGRGR